MDGWIECAVPVGLVELSSREAARVWHVGLCKVSWSMGVLC